MNPIQTAIPYFSEDELKCKGTGVIKIDPRFASKLIDLRKCWGKPLVPSSVCRTPEHNKAVGGHPRSLHLTENPAWDTFGTAAIDIKWSGWPHVNQQAFAQLAREKGFRVGLNNSFCHLDIGHEVGIKKGVFLYAGYDGKVSVS